MFLTERILFYVGSMRLESPNGFEFLDVVSLTGTNFDVFSYMPLPVRLFKEKKNSFDYLETVSKRYSHYIELLTTVE